MHRFVAIVGPSLGTTRRLAVAGTLLLLVALAWRSELVVAQDGDAATTPVAAETAVEAAVTEAPDEPHRPGFFEVVFSGGLLGIAFVVVLFALSLLALYLIVEQALALRRPAILPPGLADDVGEAVRAGQIGAAKQICLNRRSVLSFVILKGLEDADGGWPAIEKSLEDALAEQSARLFRKIEYLSALGGIAPMIGLLGTVTGMIIAFQEVAVSRGSANAGDLAEGIYQALVTTVGGLLIAIPSLGAFAVFRNRVDQLIAEVAYDAMHALKPLKRRGTAPTNVPAATHTPTPTGGRVPPPPPGT